VLPADKEPELSKLISAMLGWNGFKVTSVLNGGEARELIRQLVRRTRPGPYRLEQISPRPVQTKKPNEKAG
jgi:CheY-like chemotaxis protein